MSSQSAAQFIFRMFCMAAFWLSQDAAASLNPVANLDHSVWTEARGWTQHLSAMQNSPRHWESLIIRTTSNELPQQFDACLRISFSDVLLADRCSEIALREIRASLDKNGIVEKELFERVRLLTSILNKSKVQTLWTTWLRYASISVSVGDFPEAKGLLLQARKAASRDFASTQWITDRLNLFEQSLQSLSADVQTADSPAETAAGVLERMDAQSMLLSAKLSGLRSASGGYDEDVRGRKTVDEKLSELARKRWIVDLDRAEIEAVRKRVLSGQMDMESIRRINSLVTEHRFNNKEWSAIVAVLAGVARKVEMLTKNEGLLLPLEVWLSKESSSVDAMIVDDDKELLAHQRILEEFISRLARLVERSVPFLNSTEEQAEGKLIVERLQGMNSTVGSLLSGVALSEQRERVQLQRSLITSGDLRLRNIQARLASLEFSKNFDANSISLIRSYGLEVRSLRLQRKKLISHLFLDTLFDMPITNARLRVLLNRKDQVQSTLNELKVLLSGIEKRNLVGTQAGHFFLDSQRFLNGLTLSLKKFLNGKKVESQKIAKSYDSIAAEVDSFRGELERFLTSEFVQLRPRFLKMLSAIDLDLYSRARSLELQEQIAQSEIRDRLAADRRKTEWKRDRINDIRRIRGENLEWRSGR